MLLHSFSLSLSLSIYILFSLTCLLSLCLYISVLYSYLFRIYIYRASSTLCILQLSVLYTLHTYIILILIMISIDKYIIYGMAVTIQSINQINQSTNQPINHPTATLTNQNKFSPCIFDFANCFSASRKSFHLVYVRFIVFLYQFLFLF